MTKREWKVGERCWVFVPVNGRRVAREAEVRATCMTMIDVRRRTGGGYVGHTPLRSDVFETKEEATLAGLERDVLAMRSRIERTEEQDVERRRLLDEERKALAKAEKRLAALRAKVKP